MEHNARHLYERGDIREGVSLAQARDVMLVYSSPELYELLVLRQAWPLERYGRFVAQGMIAPSCLRRLANESVRVQKPVLVGLHRRIM